MTSKTPLLPPFTGIESVNFRFIKFYFMLMHSPFITLYNEFIGQKQINIFSLFQQFKDELVFEL